MTYEVGDRVPVGKHFWISESAFIGYDKDAKHRDGLDSQPGSAEPGCILTIRAFEGDEAVVRLDRPAIPYGARAPIGTVFFMPVEELAMHAEWAKRVKAQSKAREEAAARYCQ